MSQTAVILIVSILTLLVSCQTPSASSMSADADRRESTVPTKRKFTSGQRLVIAAFNLEIEEVNRLISEGVNPDSRLGFYDTYLFEDKWTLGLSPYGSEKWTPLLAVSQSQMAPQPKQKTVNTTEGRAEAEQRLKKIDPNVIKARDKRRVSIAKALIAAGANLDLHDGYGGTPLAHAVYNDYEELGLLLISSGANVKTKTGVYIDGTDGIEPIHRATKNVTLLKALLKHGADANAKDGAGDTPLHWATLSANKESVGILIAAGADLNAKNREGHTPIYWVQTYGEVESATDRRKKEIEEMLLKAGAKKPPDELEQDSPADAD